MVDLPLKQRLSTMQPVHVLTCARVTVTTHTMRLPEKEIKLRSGICEGSGFGSNVTVGLWVWHDDDAWSYEYMGIASRVRYDDDVTIGLWVWHRQSVRVVGEAGRTLMRPGARCLLHDQEAPAPLVRRPLQ